MPPRSNQKGRVRLARPLDGGVELSGARLEKAEEILAVVRKWVKNLQLDPRTVIAIKAVDAPWDNAAEDRGKWWLMKVDFAQAEYRTFWLEISTGLLDSEDNEHLDAAVIHELVHLLAYQYTWLADQLSSGPASTSSALSEAEETLVCDMSIALCAVAGVNDGTKG